MAETRREAREKLNFNQLLKQMTESKKTFRLGSSKEFEEVQNALKEVVNLSDKTVEESTKNMAEAHERLGKACDAYLKARTGAITDKGKDRLELVGVISSLQKREADGVKAMQNPEIFKKDKGKKWSDVLFDRRVTEINVTGKDMSTVGAGSSTRTVVSMGNDGKGFFTDDQTVLSKEETYQERIRTAKSKNVKKAYETLLNDIKTRESLEFTVQMTLGNENFNSALEKSINQFDGGLWNAIGWKDICKNPQDKAEFLNGLMEIAKADTARDLLEEAGVKIGENLPIRNVASSRLAELLGQDMLLAKSEVVCLRNGNEFRKGVIMEKAIGLDFNEKKQNMETFGRVNDFSDPDLQRQVTSLEVLDYLSGQIDRHVGNMFYQFEKDAAGNQKLIGIQGIDNDAAFGTIIPQKGLRTLVNINEITMIDDALAESIKKVNQDDLKYIFGDLLNKDEIDSLGKRFDQVKEKIQNGTIKCPEQWNAATSKEILKRDGYLATIKSHFDGMKSSLAEMEKETAGKETKERLTAKDLLEEKENKTPKLAAYRKKENKVKELRTPVFQKK